MKKLILISTFLFSGMVINAQNASVAKPASGAKEKPADAETRATKQTNELDKIVTLSPEQKTKALAINLDKNKLVDAARAKAGEDKNTFETERKKINIDRRKEIGALLTPAQIDLWKKAKKED